MWIFLAGDAMSFGALLAAYGVLRYSSVDWPVPAISSVTMVYSLASIQHGDQLWFKIFLALTVLSGVIFLSLQAYEWTHLIHEGLGFTANKWGASLFGTTFFAITGFHGAHVTAGVIYLSFYLIQGLRGRLPRDAANHIEIAALYWHFVDLVWILVFTFVYLL